MPERAFTPFEQELKQRYERLQRLLDNEFLLHRSSSDAVYEMLRRLKLQVEKSESLSDIEFLEINIGDFVAKTFADLLFLKNPRISGESDQENEFITNLFKKNKLWSALWESAYENAGLGDQYVKLRVDPENVKHVIVEFQDPAIVFPQFASDQAREPIHYDLKWIEHRGEDMFLRIESHFKGAIVNRVFELNESEEIGREMSIEEWDVTIPSFIETGVDDRFLIIHIPNFRRPRQFFGKSDLDDLENLIIKLSERVTKLDQAIERQEDPVFAGPGHYLDDDDKFRYNGANFYPREEGDPEVSPIVWDPQVTNALAFIDKLSDLIMSLAEIWVGLFKQKEQFPESGKSLERRMIRTLAKRDRKRTFYGDGIKDMVITAELLAQQWKVGDDHSGFTPSEPDITWVDALPFDVGEQSEIEVRRVDAGIGSRKAAIRRLDQVDDEAAEQELKQIEEEEPDLGFDKPRPPVVTNAD